MSGFSQYVTFCEVVLPKQAFVIHVQHIAICVKKRSNISKLSKQIEDIW